MEQILKVVLGCRRSTWYHHEHGALTRLGLDERINVASYEVADLNGARDPVREERLKACVVSLGGTDPRRYPTAPFC